MKIAIVGPTLPFRSGIARHTDALASALAQDTQRNVTVYSFSRQYPKWLFPGESDTDPNAAPPTTYHTRYNLDSINPLSWRAVANAVVKDAPDLVIIPAWTFFTAPALGTIARRLRKAGIEVVMIVHNATDHEASRWKSAMSRYQLRAADRFVTHNKALADDIVALGINAPAVVSRHPVYDDYPDAHRTLPRERKLELLFFGLVRPYKGLDLALNALAQSALNDVRLSIVGEFWSGMEETQALIEQLGLSEHVDLVARYVSDQEAAEYFHRADAVLAPYRTATGSGVVALAQHYGRPVIASDAPGLAEAITPGRTGWLFPAGDIGALSALLAGAVSRKNAAAMAPAIEACREELSWPRFAQSVLRGDSEKEKAMWSSYNSYTD